jgi:hypothetical protein
VSRPALGSTQPTVQSLPGVLSLGLKRSRGVTLTTHPHLVPRSWITRSYTSSPHCATIGVLWDFFTFDFTALVTHQMSSQYSTPTRHLWCDISKWVITVFHLRHVATSQNTHTRHSSQKLRLFDLCIISVFNVLQYLYRLIKRSLVNFGVSKSAFITYITQRSCRCGTKLPTLIMCRRSDETFRTWEVILKPCSGNR